MTTFDIRAIVVASLVFAGCATRQVAPISNQPEPNDNQGRTCVAALDPDGLPNFSSGCTGNERLFFEDNYIP